MHRRIASFVRRSLTVVLCLTDDEASSLCSPLSLLPGISSCPIVRLEPWSTRSMYQAATRDLAKPSSTAGAISDSEFTIRARGGSTATPGTNRTNNQSERNDGKIRLWEGSTHANLVGILSFGRFQSTVAAVKNVAPITETNTPSQGTDEDGAIERFKANVAVTIAEAERVFDSWMALAEPSCVAVFRAVEMCSGGGSQGALLALQGGGDVSVYRRDNFLYAPFRA